MYTLLSKPGSQFRLQHPLSYHLNLHPHYLAISLYSEVPRVPSLIKIRPLSTISASPSPLEREASTTLYSFVLIVYLNLCTVQPYPCL